jgi:hypothetical protein
LFEPNYPSLVAYVEKEIREAMSFWLPYIHIENLNVKVPDVGVNNTSFIDRMHGLKVELTFGLVNNKLDTRTIVLEIKAD